MGTYSDLADIKKTAPQPLAEKPVEAVATVKTVTTVIPKSEVTQDRTQKVTRKVTQSPTQLSKKISTLSSKRSHDQPSADEIEYLAYRLRKVNKIRVNADVPRAWKERLDDLAFRLKVGKYELMLYVIAQFLEEDRAPEDGD